MPAVFSVHIHTWGEDNFSHRGYLCQYIRIFELAPAAEAMYRFGRQNRDEELDVEAMYKSPLFVAHAKAVLGTVDAAVGLVKEGKASSLANVLVDMGRRHFAYGVKVSPGDDFSG